MTLDMTVPSSKVNVQRKEILTVDTVTNYTFTCDLKAFFSCHKVICREKK